MVPEMVVFNELKQLMFREGFVNVVSLCEFPPPKLCKINYGDHNSLSLSVPCDV
jgi:hypothetical protein